MNDEKSISKKLTKVISKAADTVKHAVSQVVESASEAAQHAMEANAEKISRIPPARTGPGQLAGTTNEQVYIPETSDAAAMPMPLVPVIPAAKERKAQARPAPAKKRVAKTGAARSVKKKAAVNKRAKSPVKSRGRPSKPARGRSGK